PTEDNSELYAKVDKLIPHLQENDYEKDEKTRHVTLTEDGNENIEKLQRHGLQQAAALHSGRFDFLVGNETAFATPKLPRCAKFVNAEKRAGDGRSHI